MKADIRIHSLGQYLDEVSKLRGAWSDTYRADCWFRGLSRSSHKLVPGHYRSDALNIDEVSLRNEFDALARSMLHKPSADDWELYFLMQHYGVQTRLLDWSESPLIAAYFALCFGAESKDRIAGDPPCVWMLDAGTLNEEIYGEYEVIAPRGSFSNHWLPSEDAKIRRFKFKSKRYSNEFPIAIWPARADTRIVAQHGVFTVHGVSRQPLEEAVEKWPKVKMRRFVFSKIEQLQSDLESACVDDLAAFPELGSVVRRIKRYHRTR